MWMLHSLRVMTEIMKVITKGREIDMLMLIIAKNDSQGYSLEGCALNVGILGKEKRKGFFEATVRMRCNLFYLQAFYDYRKT